MVHESRDGNGSSTTCFYSTSNFFLLILGILCYAGLEILVPEEGMLSLGDTIMIPLNLKFRLSSGYFGSSCLQINRQIGNYGVG